MVCTLWDPAVCSAANVSLTPAQLYLFATQDAIAMVDVGCRTTAQV